MCHGLVPVFRRVFEGTGYPISDRYTPIDLNLINFHLLQFLSKGVQRDRCKIHKLLGVHKLPMVFPTLSTI